MTKEGLQMHKKLCFRCKNCFTNIDNNNELELHNIKKYDNLDDIFKSKNLLKQDPCKKKVSTDEQQEDKCSKKIEAQKRF